MKALVGESARPNTSSVDKDMSDVILSADAQTVRAKLRWEVRVGRSFIKATDRVIYPTAHVTRSTFNPSWKPLSDLLAAQLKPSCAGKAQPEALVRVDASVPWRVVHRVVAAIYAAGVNQVLFAFQKPTAMAKPPRSKIDPVIDKVDADIAKRQKAGTKAMLAYLRAWRPTSEHPSWSVYQRCKTVLAGLEQARKRMDIGGYSYFAEGLANDIASCGCAVDLDAAKSLHWWWSDRRTKEQLIEADVRLVLSSAKAKRRELLVAKHDTPWSKAHTIVVDAAKRGGAFLLAEKGAKVSAADRKARQSPPLCK